MLIPGPVGVFVHAGPGLIVSSLVLERVGVGGLLDRRGEPVAGVAVRPGVHACRQVAVLLGDAVQHPVDHGHGLGAGDVGVGTEGAVLEALDPAQFRGPLNILLRPVALDVGEGLGAAALSGVKPGTDGGELGAGDGGLGVKGIGAAALDDAQPRHGGDGGVGPVIVRHIGIGIAGQQIAVTDGILQQAEEDGGGLCPGDQAVGPDVAVLVADDIGEVVGVIQQVWGRTAVVPNRLGLLLCRGLIGGQVILFHADLAAAHNIPLGSGQLLIVQLALGIDLAVIACRNTEQGDAAAVGGCRGNLLPVQIQSELRAVQGVTVLRVHLFNGEIVVGGGGAAAGVFAPLRIYVYGQGAGDNSAIVKRASLAIPLGIPAGEGITSAGGVGDHRVPKRFPVRYGHGFRFAAPIVPIEHHME